MSQGGEGDPLSSGVIAQASVGAGLEEEGG